MDILLSDRILEMRKTDAKGEREKFAWSLVRLDVFTTAEREGSNCNGVGEKPLDKKKLAAV